MGLVRDEIELVGVAKSRKLVALFDSGALRNYIRRQFMDGEGVEDIGFHVYEGTHRSILADSSTATGEKVRFKELRLRDRSSYNPDFVILDGLVEEAIIGARLMQELGIVLDATNENLELRTTAREH